MVRANESGRGKSMTRDTRLGSVSIVALVLAVVVGVLAGRSGTAQAATQVDLGTAGAFAVLAGSTITNTGPTTITGDVGLHPGSAVTGFDSVTLNGELHVADGTALQAKDDLGTAYDNAASQGPSTTVSTELGGQVLPGGVYDSASGTFGITGTVTLDAQGTPGTVWIFQTGSTLITASDSRVRLINGADACNVFWQVGSSATLGTGTSFAGNILAATSVTLNTSATIRGRALARTGAVTMDTNTIQRANCSSQSTPSEPDPSPTRSASPSPTPSPSASPTVSPTPTPTPTTTPTTTPAPAVSASPSEVAVPVDSTTGTPEAPDAATGGAGTPQAPDAPGVAAPRDATEAGAPSDSTAATSETSQVAEVPTGAVPAGDGSMATDGERSPGGLLLASTVAGLALFAAWRRRDA